MPACRLMSPSSLRNGVVKEEDVDEDEGPVLDFADGDEPPLDGVSEAFGSAPVVLVW